MYKKFFMGIAAMAAMTLVSCSSEDLNSLSDNSSKNEAISFDGYLGRSAVSVHGSRGSEEKVDQLKTDGFGVFGNYSEESEGTKTVYGKNWFDNVKVTCPSSAWTYEPLKYWLPKGHIDFLAYAPHVDKKELKNNTDNSALSCIDFNVPSTIAEQKDLLWANATNQRKTDKPVTFKFNHALAKIGYTVKTNVVGTGGTTITLNKITLAGSDTEPATGAFYEKGTIDLSKTTGASDLWTNLQGEQKFTWFDGTKQLTSTSAFNNSNISDNPENPDENYLFVIPQDFTGAHKLYVVVDYTITYNTGNVETMTNQVSQQLSYNFKQGKAYMINLTVGLTPIQFEANVTPWTDDNNKNTDIPVTWN